MERVDRWLECPHFTDVEIEAMRWIGFMRGQIIRGDHVITDYILGPLYMLHLKHD